MIISSSRTVRAHTSLRQSYELLRTLIDRSSDGIAAVDDGLRYIMFNDAYGAEFERMFARPLWPGDSVLDGLDDVPEQREEIYRAWTRALAGEQFTQVLQLPTQGGEAHAYEISYGSLALADGGHGAFAIAREVSERLRAEQEVHRLNAELEAQVQRRTWQLEQANRALRSQGTRLRAALDASHTGTFSWDVGAGVLQWDENLRRLLGREERPARVVVDELFAAADGADRQLLAAALRRGRVPGQSVRVSFRVCGDREHPRWLHVVAESSLREGSTHLIGACSDITALKQAERVLSEQEARVRALADSMPVIVWTRGRDGGLEYINRRWTEYTGISFEETAQCSLDGLIHPQDLPRVRREIVAARDSGGVFQSEYRLRAADGQYRWHLVRSFPEHDEQGDIQRWYGTGTDIEEQVRVRARLQEMQQALEASNRDLADSLAQLSAVIDNMTEGLLICDREGALVAANPAARQLHGYRREDGRQLEALSDRLDVRDLAERPVPYAEWPLSRVLRGERFSGCEVQVRRLDNGENWIASYGGAPVRDAEGGVRYAILTLRDVTGEKARERALEAAVQARDRFLAVAAHELRTPLTTLLMQVQMARRRMAAQGEDASPAQFSRALDVADRQVRRLARLVDDLLDVTRSEVGQLGLRRNRCDLAQMAQEMAAQFQASFEACGCILELDCPETLVGCWDRPRLEQVVGNLLGNVTRYAPGARARLSVYREAEAAVLVVEDDGPGIPSQAQAHIFERFARAAPERPEGLGLGLYLVEQIVRGHGGRIDLLSEPGQGCRFTVRLPLEPPTPA